MTLREIVATAVEDALCEQAWFTNALRGVGSPGLSVVQAGLCTVADAAISLIAEECAKEIDKVKAEARGDQAMLLPILAVLTGLSARIRQLAHKETGE